MQKNPNDIVTKDSSIEPLIYNILNEAYHEFVEMYGEKHSSRVKERIEFVTDKVREARFYYSGSIAQANAHRRCYIYQIG